MGRGEVGATDMGLSCQSSSWPPVESPASTPLLHFGIREQAEEVKANLTVPGYVELINYLKIQCVRALYQGFSNLNRHTHHPGILLGFRF